MTKQIKVLIVDDEAALVHFLADLLTQLKPDWQIDVFTDSLTALESLTSHLYDIVFCDIKMPGIDGLKLLQLNHQLANPCPYWVFVTAFDQHAIQAFELAAFDYLLKPIQSDRLQQTLQRATELNKPAQNVNILPQHLSENLNLNESKIKEPLEWLKLSHGNQLKMMSVDDIHYFQAEDKMVCVYNDSLQGCIRKSIKELISILPNRDFVQIHRSLLVKISEIERIEKDELGHWQLKLKQGNILPISRHYQKQFRGD